jgi:RNA polymerase sigma factor (sigma-70 family)
MTLPISVTGSFFDCQSKNLVSLALRNAINQTHPCGEERLFYLLYEFALRICYRYTSYNSNPETTVYEGFIKFFRSAGQEFNSSGSSFFIRDQLKRILIDTCIEKARLETQTEQCIPKKDFSVLQISKEKMPECISSKEMINALRMLSFPDRIVFNLLVIDRFDQQEISYKLQIPIAEVETSLETAREKLRMAVLPYLNIAT